MYTAHILPMADMNAITSERISYKDNASPPFMIAFQGGSAKQPTVMAAPFDSLLILRIYVKIFCE